MEPLKNTQPSNQQVLTEVKGLGTTVNNLGTTVSGLVTTVGGLVTTVSGLVSTVGDLTTTVEDLASAVNKFANKVEERFDRVESDIKDMKRTMTTLATKDFVAKEVAKLRGDHVVTMRKEDKKLGELVTVLREKNVIDDADVKRVVTMEPFAQLIV